MHPTYVASVRAGMLAAALFAGNALAHVPDDTSKPFDRYAWVTTHNAFTSNGLVPNQSQTIHQQLAAGVRSLMLDLHHHDGRVRLCHQTCRSGSETFADLLNNTVLPFLRAFPNEIVTLHLEDYTSPEQLAAELNLAPGLAGLTFDPDTWSTPEWPTYQAMIDSGQRVLVFTHSADNIGSFMTRSGVVNIMPSEEFTVENYWSLGTTVFQHDDRCYSRWSDQVLSRREISWKPGWRPLFTMNQFHGVPIWLHHDNAFDTLMTRYRDHCLPAAQRKPNYVAVDFHEQGDAARFVEWLNRQPHEPP